MTHVALSTVIHADAESLWQEIGAFGRVGDWHPWLERVETEGRQRIPYDKQGRRHVETLQESDAQARCYRYTIDQSPMPIRNHWPGPEGVAALRGSSSKGVAGR